MAAVLGAVCGRSRNLSSQRMIASRNLPDRSTGGECGCECGWVSGCAHAHLWGYAAGMQGICVSVQHVTFKAEIYDHSWTRLSAVVRT